MRIEDSAVSGFQAEAILERAQCANVGIHVDAADPGGEKSKSRRHGNREARLALIKSDKTALRRTMNRVLGKLARSVPGATTVRPWLHRLRGVEINGRVFIGDDVYLENEYPERVRLEDGAQIGLRSTIIAHTRTSGRVIIGRNAFIGACSVIVSPADGSLTIGDDAVISVGSIITTNIPAATLVRPERVKGCARVTVPFTYETSYGEFRRGLRPLKSAPEVPPKEAVDIPAVREKST